MGFRGYKLRHKITVFEKFKESEDSNPVHAKTYEITLYISSFRPGFVRFDEIESMTSRILDKYSEQILDQSPPFDKIEPTLENVGKFFSQLLSNAFSQAGLYLTAFEISESPIRTFVANLKDSDQRIFVGDNKVKISELLVDNMISRSITHTIANIEEQSFSPQADDLSGEQIKNEYTAASNDGVVEQSTAAATADESSEISLEENSITPITPSESSDRASSIISEQESESVEMEAELKDSKRFLFFKHSGTSAIQFISAVLFLSLCGAFLALYLRNTGAYPSGADIFGHLFKSDLLYHRICEGDYYPLYTELWYNGMQPYRYWAPLPYYLLAGLQFLAGGDVGTSYLFFVAFSITIGGIGWLLWGLAYKKMMFSTFLALVWFFLPDNIRVFFVEGNLPRMMIAILLPYLFYFVWMFVDRRRIRMVFPVIITMALITLSHVMIAAMTGISTFLFLLIYSIYKKRMKESFQILCSMLLSFAICGFWLYPALNGGLVDMDASATGEVMRALSTSILVSLNPLLRNQGMYEMFYFGISILVISIAGLFLAEKKSAPGLLTVILIFIGTTPTMVNFLDKLPLNQLFWMTRFAPIAYVFFFLSLLEWKNCRRYVLLVIALIIILDCIPSMNLERYHSRTPVVISHAFADAKESTGQRISLLDVSAYGSYPSFYFSAEEPQTLYTFGWAWQAATTAPNIVMVNTALEKGYYHYLFDRSLELGDDTILVKKELVTKAKKTLRALSEAAAASGYSLSQETNFTYVYHRDTPKNFGVKSKYEALAVGISARSIALEYPCFEEGESRNIENYSVDELSRYKVLYLSAFTYNDRKAAEKILTQAANNGVKIIIDMNRIPVDPVTNRMAIFGVSAQPITFTEHYPELIYRNKVYETVPFKKEFSTWSTVYLENLGQTYGYSWFQNKTLHFLGTAGNENIIFLGYNFLYHAMETDDEAVMTLLGDLLGMEENQLPERELVPINVAYQEDEIVIDSPGGKLNTTIAYQDNFRSKQPIEDKNNLLIVTKEHTEIKIVYPYLFQGMIISLFGLLGAAILIYLIYRERRHSE